MGQTTEELHIAVRQVDGRDGFGDQTQIANGRDEARDRPALRSLNDGHSPHRHGEELEPRRIEWIRICDVRPDPLNAKLHHLGEIVTSIKKRGFVELPAVDERTGKLVAGHGRIEALAALKKDGGELPKGLKLADDGEWLVPVLHGWASKDDTDAKAYLVASNRLVEVGGWDDAALESLLVSIAKEGGAEALLGTGYDGDDVDKILSDLAKEPSAVKHQGDVFQVLVEVSGEVAQSELMTRLEGEGFKVRPLIF